MFPVEGAFQRRGAAEQRINMKNRRGGSTGERREGEREAGDGGRSHLAEREKKEDIDESPDRTDELIRGTLDGDGRPRFSAVPKPRKLRTVPKSGKFDVRRDTPRNFQPFGNFKRITQSSLGFGGLVNYRQYV